MSEIADLDEFKKARAALLAQVNRIDGAIMYIESRIESAKRVNEIAIEKENKDAQKGDTGSGVSGGGI